MNIHYQRCVLTHTLLRNFHMNKLTKIKFKDEVDNALFNLSISYLDFLDETIKLYEEKRYTLFNYSCRMLIEIFFIMNALIKDPTVLEKLKNKQDRETIKIKREGINYSMHKETIMEQTVQYLAGRPRIAGSHIAIFDLADYLIFANDHRVETRSNHQQMPYRFLIFVIVKMVLKLMIMMKGLHLKIINYQQPTKNRSKYYYQIKLYQKQYATR